MVLTGSYLYRDRSKTAPTNLLSFFPIRISLCCPRIGWVISCLVHIEFIFIGMSLFHLYIGREDRWDRCSWVLASSSSSSSSLVDRWRRGKASNWRHRVRFFWEHGLKDRKSTLLLFFNQVDWLDVEFLFFILRSFPMAIRPTTTTDQSPEISCACSSFPQHSVEYAQHSAAPDEIVYSFTEVISYFHQQHARSFRLLFESCWWRK